MSDFKKVSSPQFLQMETYIRGLQNTICDELNRLNKSPYQEDSWNKEKNTGGGITRIYTGGKFLEKGGVNISSVSGPLPSLLAEKLNTEAMDYRACGLSLVLHSKNPKIPTIHMNVRYFEMENGDAWFGGGVDLTPFYPYKEDFIHFHKTMKEACGEDLYPKYKKECDSYFYLPHRNEMRGIGGIFFDYLKEDLENTFNLVKNVGDHFLPSYIPIVEKRMNESFDEQDKEFQLIRRGRYVEFNLLYDRGTLFGLKTGGRTESILMSLPYEVKFPYDFKPETNSPQEVYQFPNFCW